MEQNNVPAVGGLTAESVLSSIIADGYLSDTNTARAREALATRAPADLEGLTHEQIVLDTAAAICALPTNEFLQDGGAQLKAKIAEALALSTTKQVSEPVVAWAVMAGDVVEHTARSKEVCESWLEYTQDRKVVPLGVITAQASPVPANDVQGEREAGASAAQQMRFMQLVLESIEEILGEHYDAAIGHARSVQAVMQAWKAEAEQRRSDTERDAALLRQVIEQGVQLHFEGRDESEAVWADDVMEWTEGDRLKATHKAVGLAIQKRAASNGNGEKGGDRA